MKNRLQSHIESQNKLSEMQNGFRRGRRISDNIYILSQIIEISQKQKSDLFMCFLDIEKAYDRVDREKLFDVMRKMGIDGEFVNLLGLLYKDGGYIYQWEDIETNKIGSEIGLKQGCPLSPMLFVLYLESLATKLMSTGKGFKIKDCTNEEMKEFTIPGLFLADDIALFGETEADLQELLNQCSSYGVEFTVKFSMSKTKYLHFGCDLAEYPRFKLGDNAVERCRSYTYLGVEICDQKDYLAIHKENLSKKAIKYKGIIKCTMFQSFSKYEVSRTLFKQIAVPALTYANDVLWFGYKLLQKFEVHQSEIGRLALGGNKFTGIEAIRGEMGWSSFVSRDDRSKIKYLHRLKSLPVGNWARKVLEYVVLFNWRTSWDKQLQQLGQKYLLSYNELCYRTSSELEKFVVSHDTAHWRQGIENKKTLQRYAQKPSITREFLYDNSLGSALLFKSRAGSLETETRMEKITGNTRDCKLCHKGEEDIPHVLLQCSALQSSRGSLVEQGCSNYGEPSWSESQIAQLLGFCGSQGWELQGNYPFSG
jgi:Reverse transcriptase (RNA-dependent DNA polymerase)